jgi:hypothetical protein
METRRPVVRVRDDEAEAFLRSWAGFAEEDRWRWTSAPWRGEYRYFRSPNVIPLEKYRRLVLTLADLPRSA